MKFLSASTGREWATLDGSESGTEQHLDRFLADLLLSENLIVLCGLGTSLAVTGPLGLRQAPTMQDLWNGVKAAIGQNFDSIAEAVHYAGTDENIELLLSHAQMIQSLTPTTQIAEFVKTAEQVIVDACRFVTPEADLSTHTTFLQKVARRSTRLPRMRLFTTNYDVCFERAASHTNFIVVDGFSHTHPQTFDGACFGYDFVRREQDKEIPDYLPNVFQLYKLHGSIDWEVSANQIIRTDKPVRPLIIYPRDSKFASSYDQPFLEMMSRLQIALRQPNTGLLVIGFGFNDAHLAQPMLSALRSNVSLKAIIVGPEIVTEADHRPALVEVRDLVRKGDFRLALLSGKFEDLVPMLPDLVAATEDERHRGRLRRGGSTL